MKRRLVIRRETLRALAAADLQAVVGGGFSDPRISCDSCSHCPCLPK